ncbi:MAG TPA: S8 family serine peptidase [bacterium]|nr:S8 family serine peptidase [bacterium]HPN44635.1 S8 family serine peptidase [bacterium]
MVGVLDSGIPMQNGVLSHPDLNDNRIELGYDYVYYDNEPRDLCGHGTHVAGIIGAETNNSAGVAGTSWGTQLYIVQAFGDDGIGTLAAFYYGVIDAVDEGAKIINYSGGGTVSSTYYTDAIVYALNRNCLIVAAAGNEAASVIYPAKYSPSYNNVMAVSATNYNDTYASYTNRGVEICVAAPGGTGLPFGVDDIFSTTPNYYFALQSEGVTQNYGYMSGTSMAAPFVSGLAALIQSTNLDLSPEQIRQTIQLSVDDLGASGFDNYYGYGRINVNKALHNLYVPEIYSTIQTALDAAATGQNIILHSGSQTLASNLVIPDNIALVVQSGTTLNLNNFCIETESGEIIVESGATILPKKIMREDHYTDDIKGLYPIIEAAMDSSETDENIVLGAGTFTENVVMKDHRYFEGKSKTQTIINGTFIFADIEFGELDKVKVNNDIVIDDCSDITLSNVIAKDIVEIENTATVYIGDSEFTNNGFLDTYQTYNVETEYTDFLYSTNYGIITGDTDLDIWYNTIMSKNRGLHCAIGNNVDIYYTDFCSNTYDIFNTSSLYIDIWQMGSMSSCPPPLSGSNITLHYPCEVCDLGKSNPDEILPEYSQSWEGIDDSPEGLEFAELRDLYRALKVDRRQARKDSIRYDISKYAPKYNQVIDGMKQFVGKYPDSEEAKHAIKLIDFCYRALKQRDTFAAYLVALGKDAKYKSLQSAIKSQFIPYYLGKGEYQTALTLTDEVMKAQTDPENALYYLYRKGVIYHKYLKDAAKAEAIYKQVIDTDPNSAMAFSAGVRLGKLGKVYEGENKPSADEPEVKFAIRNHPNPFNPVTNIQFDLPAADHVTLKVYDVTGREVVTLVDALQGSGSHTIAWNSQDKFGQRVASGMYFYRIEYRGQVLTNKMILMR